MNELGVEPKWNAWQVTHAICHACRGAFGLSVDAPPSQRPPVPCTRCGRTQLVRILVREQTGEYSTLVPMALTFGRVTDSSFWNSKQATPPDSTVPFGVLDAYVCRKFGFTDLFTREPEKIPIGVECGTELIDVGPRAPYR